MRRGRRHLALYLAALAVAGGMGAAAERAFAPDDPAGSATFEESAAVYRVDAAGYEPRRGGPLFLIIAGTDDRPGVSGARNDALHLVGVNPEHGRATILNIPRDTWVAIPGHGHQKITAAHQLGGPQLLADTVAGLTGIHAPYVFSTNFAGFVGLVDAVGGVWVEVPYAVSDSASGASFPPGRHLLSGEAALALARARKGVPGGDFGRTENQGRLLLAALAQVRDGDGSFAATAANVATLLTHVRPHGLGVADVWALARLALSIDPANVANITMPGSTGAAGGQSVVHPSGEAPALFADLADNGIVGG